MAGIHSMFNCEQPNLLQKCAECLVYSMDGTGHAVSCQSYDRIVKIRTDFTKKPSKLFAMRVGNNNDVVHILNKKTGAFDEVTATNPEFHAHEVDGVFTIMKNHIGKSVIRFFATALNRFSIGVAYMLQGVWRLRYRLVVTRESGILCFPLFNNANYVQ